MDFFANACGHRVLGIEIYFLCHQKQPSFDDALQSLERQASKYQCRCRVRIPSVANNTL